MKVREVMTSRVIAVSPETPLKEVARVLADHGISGVPVVEAGGSVVGVVSEADFLLKEQDVPTGRRSLVAWLFDGADGQQARQDKLHATTAREAMTSPAVVIGPEHGVRDAAALMTRKRINRLPVVEDAELVGIVTRADVVETFLVPDEALEHRIAEEIVRDTMWMGPTRSSFTYVTGWRRWPGPSTAVRRPPSWLGWWGTWTGSWAFDRSCGGSSTTATSNRSASSTTNQRRHRSPLGNARAEGRDQARRNSRPIAMSGR